jgi:hypothetical protein
MNEKPEAQNPDTTPYVGLMPFTEKDADYFFGRAADIEIVATNLRAACLTIFYGASGVGKSSLLNAGVLPYLQKISTASILPGEPPEFILVVLREWANNPIDSLRLRIKNEVEKAVGQGRISHLTLAEVEKTARANEHNSNMSELLKNWTDLIKTDLLIIFDQFEDFFLHPEFATGVGSFGEEFPKALNNRDLPVNFMLSMRDDALAKLDFFKGKIQDPMKNTLRLLHLDRDATAEAIRKPLDKYNEIMGTSFTIKDELVEKLLDDVQVDKVKFDTQGQAAVSQLDMVPSDSPAANKYYRVETPYLQLVMERLWKDETTQSEKCLTLNTLEQKLGGVQNIVEMHLDDVMKQFNDADKELASEFMHFTVTRSGAKIPADANDLAEWAELPDREQGKKDIKRILSQLSAGERRIFKIVPNRRDSQSPFYEVAHDALGPAILSWRKRENDAKLQKLARQEAEEKRVQEVAAIEMARQAELEKERRQKEEQAVKLKEEQEKRQVQEKLLAEELKSRKLRSILFTVVTSFIIVLAVATGLFYKSIRDKKELDEQEQTASKETETNSNRVVFEQETADLLISQKSETGAVKDTSDAYRELIGVLINLSSPSANERDSAYKNLQKLIEEKKVPEELEDSLIQMTAKIDKQKAADLRKAARDAKIERQSKPQVYIHITDESQRTTAQLYGLFLGSNGFNVQGIENVGVIKGKLSSPQIRYFRQEDLPWAEKLRDLLASKSIENVRVQFIQGYENSSAVRPKQLELWFTNDPIPDIQ